MTTTELDTKTLLERTAADLELFQLEKDFQGDLECNVPHVTIKCSIEVVATLSSCVTNLLACQNSVNRVREAIDNPLNRCRDCRRPAFVCWKITAL